MLKIVAASLLVAALGPAASTVARAACPFWCTTGERMGDISAGMTKDQVIAVLGAPDGYAQSGSTQALPLNPDWQVRAAHGYEATREAAMAAFAKSWRRVLISSAIRFPGAADLTSSTPFDIDGRGAGAAPLGVVKWLIFFKRRLEFIE